MELSDKSFSGINRVVVEPLFIIQDVACVVAIMSIASPCLVERFTAVGTTPTITTRKSVVTIAELTKSCLQFLPKKSKWLHAQLCLPYFIIELLTAKSNR